MFSYLPGWGGEQKCESKTVVVGGWVGGWGWGRCRGPSFNKYRVQARPTLLQAAAVIAPSPSPTHSPRLHHWPHCPHLLHQLLLTRLCLGRLKHLWPQLGGGLHTCGCAARGAGGGTAQTVCGKRRRPPELPGSARLLDSLPSRLRASSRRTSRRPRRQSPAPTRPSAPTQKPLRRGTTGSLSSPPCLSSLSPGTAQADQA